jgi:hypothetical protein
MVTCERVVLAAIPLKHAETKVNERGIPVPNITQCVAVVHLRPVHVLLNVLRKHLQAQIKDADKHRQQGQSQKREARRRIEIAQI